MAKQHNTGNPFDNLTYSPYVSTFVGMPIDDIKAMNIEQEKNYQQFIESSDILENTINGIKTTSNVDAPKLQAAQDDLRGFIDTAVEEGNVKSKVPLLRKYAKSMDETFGLSALQQKEATRASMIEADEKRIQEGKLNRQDAEAVRARADIEYDQRGGLTKNPNTNKWEANWNTHKLGDSINTTDLLIDKASGKLKSNISPIMKRYDPVKKQYYDAIVDYVPGAGLIYADSEESLTPEEVEAFAMQYLGNDPIYRGQVADQLYLRETRRFLSKDGMVSPTIDDVKQIVNSSNLTDYNLDKLGLKDMTDETLYSAIEDSGGVDNFIKKVDSIDIANNTIQPFVNMESFSKTTRKFYTDNLLMKSLDSYKTAEEKVKDPYVDMLVAISTNKMVSPTDMRNLITEYNTTEQSFRDLQSKVLRDSQDPNIDLEQLADARKELEGLSFRRGQIKEQIEFINNDVLSKLGGRRIITDVYDKYVVESNNIINNLRDQVASIEKQLEYADKGIPSLDPRNSDKARLERQIKEYEDRIKALTPISLKQFEKRALEKYTQSDDGTIASRAVGNLFGDPSVDSYTDDVAKSIYNKVGKFGNEPFTQKRYALFDSATLKDSKVKQVMDTTKQVLQTDRNAFKDPNSNMDLEGLVKTVYNLNPDEVNWDKSVIRPLSDVDKNGNTIFAVSVHKLKDKSDKSKGESLLGSVEVSMADSNVNSVMLDITERELKGILERSTQGDFATSFNNYVDEDKFNYLSKQWADQTGVGRTLNNLNIYLMNPGDVKEWDIPNHGKVGIKAVREVGGTNIGDLNYNLVLGGKTFGVNEDGKTGWWSESEIKLPKSFDTAAEIKSEIGGALFKTKIQNEDYNNNSNAYSTYIQHYRRGAGNINFSAVIKAESSNNPNAVSIVNGESTAIGLTQVLKLDHPKGSPLKDYNSEFNTNYTTDDLFKPDVSLAVGEWYLNNKIPQMLKTYNIADTDVHRLMAYNWGIGNLRNWVNNGSNYNSIPKETKDYIAKILG